MTSSIRSIVYLTHHFPPEVGGIQVRISKYIERLTKKGILVRVLVAGRKPSNLVSLNGAEVLACPGGAGRLPRNAKLITTCILSSRADVVHVFTGASTLLGVYSLAFARMVGARAVLSLFGREDLTFDSRTTKMLFLISSSLAQSIDINSNATARFLPESLRGKVHVLLGAADVPSASAVSQDTGPPTLLFVGRLVKRKGLDDLLQAVALVKSRFPNTRLNLVGDGPEKGNLVELAKKLGVMDSVSFKGTLFGPELDEEYFNCTIFILPSKDVATDPANEGLGLALIEASMHGKPLIATRHGGIPEIVKDRVNGLLVNPGDPKSLARAIEETLDDREFARMMGEEGMQLARSRFGWDNATDILLGSYVQ